MRTLSQALHYKLLACLPASCVTIPSPDNLFALFTNLRLLRNQNMHSTLIPERPILISPTLAATIGLKEAVLLHVMNELIVQHQPIYRNQRRWAEIEMQSLCRAMPFWDSGKIKRVLHNLQELGMVLTEDLQSAGDSRLYAINQPDHTADGPGPANTRRTPAVQSRTQPQSATLIPSDWQPDSTLLEQCRQRNIPADFIAREVPTFIQYWRDRRKSQFSWHNTFLKWVVRSWESQRSIEYARKLEEPVSELWQPSEDALTILELAGINLSFIEDAVPEFVLFWREKGVAASDWNTRFIAHVRRQWDRFLHALEHDTAPRPIPADFQPSPECYDIIGMANIDPDFADAQLKEFILYWQERNELHVSWNTKFLQHVKFKWAQQLKSSKPILQKITDRSWAD